MGSTVFFCDALYLKKFFSGCSNLERSSLPVTTKKQEIHKVISDRYARPGRELQMQEWSALLRGIYPRFHDIFRLRPIIYRGALYLSKTGWQEPPLFIFLCPLYIHPNTTQWQEPNQGPSLKIEMLLGLFSIFFYLPCYNLDFICMCTSSARIQEIPWVF